MKKINTDSILKVLIITILILSIVYLVISLINIIPFGVRFLYSEYSTDNSLSTNYLSVFNSIFTIINIIVSGCFSWILYKISNEQKNSNYNTDIASPAAAIYYTIKYHLLFSISKILKYNESILINEEYKTQNGKIGKTNDMLFSAREISSVDKIEEYVFKIIGEIEEIEIRHSLFTIVEDVRNSRNITTMLKEGLIGWETNTLLETSAKKWLSIFYNIYDDKWDDLDEDYKMVMEKLREINKSKK